MKIQAQPDDHSTALTRAVGNVTGWLGSFPAISISLGLILAWAIGGFFVAGGFSNNTHQLLINTGTTIVTFLMVFIIQNTQNREGRAMQTKLDAQSEVLAASPKPSTLMTTRTCSPASWVWRMRLRT